MISEYLLSSVRCPNCLVRVSTAPPTDSEDWLQLLEAVGEPDRPNHRGCVEHYEALWRCPESVLFKRKLVQEADGLRCECCESVFPFQATRGYIDLRPAPGTFEDLTDYAEEEFHQRRGPLRPPFLSAGIKIGEMSRMLGLSPRDRVLDIGCGNGRAAFFKGPSCGEIVAIDAGHHFAVETLATVATVRGDIRRLPFANGSFDKAYSLDVVEHLTVDGTRAMLFEARRVLRPGGLLFLYSHVLMSSRLAVVQRTVNRMVRWLDRKGLVDNRPERERKADHRNPLGSYDELAAIVAETGFRTERIRYYNVVVKAVVEDLLLPLVEHNVFGGTEKQPHSGSSSPGQEGGSRRAVKPNVGRWAHLPLALATSVMKLDIALFGRIRTGPFFLLLRAVDSP